MKIPFVDIQAQYESIAPEIDEAIAKVVAERAFINGKFVQAFEENFAVFCGARHCVGVGNGTDALFIALKALDIGPDDDVIIPANTFIATSEAATMAGENVVFVDCDPETYNINVDLIEAGITSRTKAIIPVHMYGQPADMEAIRQIADKHGLKVIQDCAQSHGAEIDGQSPVDFGDILCFSFYPGKNLGAYGDAGAIVTDNEEMAKRTRMFANHGRISKYDHEFEGVNSRMDGIQGEVLNVKLKYLPEWTERRRDNALLYDHLLKGVGDIVTPYAVDKVKHVYHLYVIRTQKRDELQQYLKDEGIATGIHYPISLPNLLAYRYLGHNPEDFPVSNQYQNGILSLPMYPELERDQIEFITEKVMKFYEL